MNQKISPCEGKGTDSMKCLHVSWSLIAAGCVDTLTDELSHAFFRVYRTFLKKVLQEMSLFHFFLKKEGINSCVF
jgi:hypothetical protein